MSNPNEDSLHAPNPNHNVNPTYMCVYLYVYMIVSLCKYFIPVVPFTFLIRYIYVELSFGFRARDESSLAFAIMMFNKGCIYIKLYFFTKFDK